MSSLHLNPTKINIEIYIDWWRIHTNSAKHTYVLVGPALSGILPLQVGVIYIQIIDFLNNKSKICYPFFIFYAWPYFQSHSFIVSNELSFIFYTQLFFDQILIEMRSRSLTVVSTSASIITCKNLNMDCNFQKCKNSSPGN